jgi:hypothetical protein
MAISNSLFPTVVGVITNNGVNERTQGNFRRLQEV